MDRRSLATNVAAALAASALTRRGFAKEIPGLQQAIDCYLALPGTPSFRVHVGTNGAGLRLEHDSSRPQFIVSAYKTFILAAFLRAVEMGNQSERQPVMIDDAVRTLGSPVFLELTGKTPSVSALEAMMAHSDNTATDAATRALGVANVRALIASAGLHSVRIPDSTRLLASYLFGAPYGVDIGWKGIVEALKGHLPGTPRSPYNDKETIIANARDLVSWYEQALAGTFFARSATLTEFKRIHSTSVQIPDILPPGSVAYAKGGEANNLFGFFAKSMAGQTILNERTPVTFCFLVNWVNHEGTGFEEVQARFFSAIADILGEIKRLYC